MRNLKRVFAVIITVAMLASLMVPALASVSYLEEAKKLQTIGLFAGTEADLKLDEDVTRIQGLTFAIRAAGKEDEALAMTDEEVEELLAKFNDADDIPFWNGNGPKYVAYAIKNGITVGDGQGNFLPLAKISGRAFLVFLLKSGMGYADVTTQTAPEVAVEAGVLTSGQAVKYALAEDGIIRDDAAAILYGAAVNGVNADGVKFIDALIESGFVKEEDAIAAGFKEVPAPSELKVESVKAPSLRQIVVTYNVAIDAAGNSDNYTLKVNDADIALIDFALQADKKTVVITLDLNAGVAIDQQDTGKLTIKDIKSGNLTLKETTVDVEFLDVTIPSAVGAEVVGIDTIEVFYSEPMLEATLENKSNFEVKDADGNTLYVKEVKAGTNNMSALVKLYANLEEGVVTITTKGVEDYNGFTILKNSFDVPVYPDEEAPAVVSYKDVSQTSVTLVFDDKIAFVSDDDGVVENFAYIYHTNSNNIAIKAEILNGNELKITFDEEYMMPVGIAYITIEKEVLTDLWNNKNAKIVVKIEVTVDEEAPYVDGTVKVLEQDKIEIPYNENLKNNFDDLEVTLLNDKGEEVEYGYEPSVDGKKLILEFSEDLYGSYTIVVKGVKDEAGNKSDKASLSFFVNDKKAPDPTKFEAKAYNVGSDTQIIVFNFKDEMDIASVTDKTMYWFSETESFDNDKIEITVVNNGKGVEIKVPKSVKNLSELLNDPDEEIEIIVGRVKDAAGNIMKELSHRVPLTKVDESVETEAKLVARNKIVLTIKDAVKDLELSKFSVIVDDNDDEVTEVEVSRVRTGTDSDGNTTITFELKDNVNANATIGVGEDRIKVVIGENAGENKYGQKVSTADAIVGDACAPELSEVKIEKYQGKDVIKLTFTEELDYLTFAQKGLNGFSVSKGEIDYIAFQLVDDDDDSESRVVAVYLVGKSDFDEKVKVSYNGAFEIADLVGNKLVAFSNKGVD